MHGVQLPVHQPSAPVGGIIEHNPLPAALGECLSVFAVLLGIAYPGLASLYAALQQAAFQGLFAAAGVAGGEIGSDRQLAFRVFGQRNTYGVAYAFLQQGGNGGYRLDSGGIPVAGLGHTQMERVIHSFLLHRAGEKTVGLYHN